MEIKYYIQFTDVSEVLIQNLDEKMYNLFLDPTGFDLPQDERVHCHSNRHKGRSKVQRIFCI